MDEQVKVAVERVCKNISTIRKLRNYSQEYVAFKIGMSQNGYGKIESNNCSITIDRLYDIAKVLNVKVVDLIEDIDLKRINEIIKDKPAIKSFLNDYYSALKKIEK